MSASLDYGLVYMGSRLEGESVLVSAKKESLAAKKPRKKGPRKKGNYKQNRKRRVVQFFQDFPNCFYCGAMLHKENRSLDHYVPRSLGGSNCFENLVSACKSCNQQKGSELPLALKNRFGSLPVGLCVKEKWKPAINAQKLWPCYSCY